MTLWRDANRKGWRYSFQYRGTRYTSHYYPTKSEAAAAQAEAKKAAKRVSQSTDGTQTPAIMAFKAAASLYLDFSERRHAKQTYEYKKLVLSNFSKVHGAISVDQITPQQILSYLNTRKTNHNFNAHRKELFCLFHYAIRVLKVIQHNPVADILRLPHTPARKTIPDETDILKLIAASDQDERNLLMVLLLTMARIDEVLRLRWEDVNFDQMTVTLWTRKRRDGNLESDAMPMNQDLRDILWRMWGSRTQNDWVFFNPKTGTRYNARPKFMRGLCKRAGIPHIGFHSLRHFMASFLADRQKISKMTISKLLRHKSLGTTEIYLHSIGEAQRAAMDGIAGIFDGESLRVTLRADLDEKPLAKAKNTQ